MGKDSTANKLTQNNRFDVLNEPSKPERNINKTNNRRSPRVSNSRNKKNNENKKTSVLPFSNNLEAFPTLSGAVNKDSIADDEYNSYANVTKPTLSVPKENDIKPGWVNINFVNNKIKYTRNPQYKNEKTNVEDKPMNGLDKDQKIKLDNIVMRWEAYRSLENEMYEEGSVFWHEKSLLAPLSDDCYSDSSENDESSIEAMDDEYDDFDDI